MTTPTPRTPVSFGDLPPNAEMPGSRGGSLRPEAIALKERPGAWARIATRDTPDKARSLARLIQAGRLAPFSEGRWEAAVSDRDVWARYLGS